jgi:hypothetical protein
MAAAARRRQVYKPSRRGSGAVRFFYKPSRQRRGSFFYKPSRCGSGSFSAAMDISVMHSGIFPFFSWLISNVFGFFPIRYIMNV